VAGALDGLRILDFSRVLAGPFATMMLGDLGAEVVKIERPGCGDDTRGWGPPFDSDGTATYFASVNRNKTSLVLDLAQPEGVARARALAADADVLVENFRPGSMERIGLGYEVLRDDNPGLVFCSITGFGRAGGAELTGYDLLVQAMGGLMSITGEPEREPQKVGVALVDVLAGLFATVGMLAAVRHRERTGQGQRVEINLLSSLLAALVNQGAAHTIAGVTPRRMGNAHPSIVPYDLYPTADGMLVLAVGTDGQFAALCRALGEPGLAEREEYASNRARVEHRDALRRELERALSGRPAGAWVSELNRAGVPAGMVNDIPAAFALAETLGLEPIVAIERPGAEAVRLTRNPIELSETPARYRRPPPALPGA
jgi:crotonobetainyl-CoA:carnitine CoA-transferase CaiB-like acyl-CoA transferase